MSDKSKIKGIAIFTILLVALLLLSFCMPRYQGQKPFPQNVHAVMTRTEGIKGSFYYAVSDDGTICRVTMTQAALIVPGQQLSCVWYKDFDGD